MLPCPTVGGSSNLLGLLELTTLHDIRDSGWDFWLVKTMNIGLVSAMVNLLELMVVTVSCLLLMGKS
jgi:hypothetical protein